MTKTSLVSLTLLTFTILSLNFLSAHGCSIYRPPGWKPRTPVQQMMRHEELIMAKVRKHIEDNRYDIDLLFTAEVDVLCILRGEEKPAVLNVTHAGQRDGLCIDVTLEVGKTYIIGLTRRNRAVTPTIPFEDFSEALEACDLNPPTYPIGVSSDTASFTCPAGKPPGQCKST